MKATRLPGSTGRRRAELLRLSGAGAAGVAVLAVWLVARHGANVDPRTPAFGDNQSTGLAGGFAVAVAVLASVLAWGFVELLQRRTQRPRRVWMVSALIVFAVSLSGPLSGGGVSGVQRLVLVCMHLVVAAVLAPVYAITLRDN